jgi:adenylate kinase
MNVILFGPPGAGKGTQADNIARVFNLHKVSTGDLLRDEIKNKTDLGKKIKSIVD